jgi:hypothetical protein
LVKHDPTLGVRNPPRKASDGLHPVDRRTCLEVSAALAHRHPSTGVARCAAL